MNLDVTVNVPHVVTVAVKAEQQAQGDEPGRYG
jgi:hypothetical protein